MHFEPSTAQKYLTRTLPSAMSLLKLHKKLCITRRNVHTRRRYPISKKLNLRDERTIFIFFSFFFFLFVWVNSSFSFLLRKQFLWDTPTAPKMETLIFKKWHRDDISICLNVSERFAWMCPTLNMSVGEKSKGKKSRGEKVTLGYCKLKE